MKASRYCNVLSKPGYSDGGSGLVVQMPDNYTILGVFLSRANVECERE
jgi:hypothetical protein